MRGVSREVVGGEGRKVRGVRAREGSNIVNGSTAGLRRWPNQPPPGSECEARFFSRRGYRDPFSGGLDFAGSSE